MQNPRGNSIIPFAVASAFGLWLAAPSAAQDDHQHKHGAPMHGGKVTMTDEYHFEVVFAKERLTVYPRSHEDKPLDASRLSGTATFYHPNAPSKAWFERKLTPTPASPGQASSSIGLAIDLSKVPATGVKVAFVVDGLPEKAEPTATFTVPFALAQSSTIVAAKATRADEKAIASQKVCPVSNEDLSSMGGPIKVSRGERSIFICCKGCLKKVEANPDQYFAATAKATQPKHEHADHN